MKVIDGCLQIIECKILVNIKEKCYTSIFWTKEIFIMGIKIAIGGKGGVGKTTICAILAQLFGYVNYFWRII